MRPVCAIGQRFIVLHKASIIRYWDEYVLLFRSGLIAWTTGRARGCVALGGSGQHDLKVIYRELVRSSDERRRKTHVEGSVASHEVGGGDGDCGCKLIVVLDASFV